MLSFSFRYSASAPKPVQSQGSTGGFSARFPPTPNANTQALIDAAAARDAELARRVALADQTQQHGARMTELMAFVDNFITADRQFLQLPGGNMHIGTSALVSLLFETGMATWERGFVHEYAGTKNLYHPTTEVMYTHHFSLPLP